MKSNITEKIKRGARVGVWGLAGIVAAGGMAGCDVVASGMRYQAQTDQGLTHQQRVARMEAANLAEIYGQRQFEMNLAREGRSEVNIYNQGQQSQEKKTMPIGLSNSLNEASRDGLSFYFHEDLNNNDDPFEEGEMLNTNMFYRGDKISVMVKIPPSAYIEGVLIDRGLNDVVVRLGKEENRSTPDWTKYSLYDLIFKDIIDAYQNPEVLKGTKRYGIETYINGQKTPYASKDFFVNFDIERKDTQR